MKTVTYQCDRCGEKSSGVNSVGLEPIYVTWGSYKNHVVDGEWCLKCREKYGLYYRKNADDPAPTAETELTLEDMVREIVREEVNSQ